MSTEEILMNWDQIGGKWKQMKRSVRQKWGKLIDDGINVIAGNEEKLAGKLQECYGISKEKAAKQIRDWSTTVPDTETTPQRRAS
jgi:uncharacterized protein YjbJ (UPF0337 family)